VDVGNDSGLSRQTVSLVEKGRWTGLTWSSIVAVASAVDAVIGASVSWRGAELDRVLDDGHARLVGLVVERLEAAGWVAKIEVTFSEFGERGSIDVLAWHPTTATLVVIEVKTELGSVEGLLRPLDIKVRLAPKIAQQQFGWRAARVARIVVFPEDRTVRRQIARHAAVMDRALPAANLEIRAWVAAPQGTLRGRWFLTDSRPVALNRNPSAVRRVRRPREATGDRSAPSIERGIGPRPGTRRAEAPENPPDEPKPSRKVSGT
jgi:hypothetical protein